MTLPFFPTSLSTPPNWQLKMCVPGISRPSSKPRKSRLLHLLLPGKVDQGTDVSVDCWLEDVTSRDDIRLHGMKRSIVSSVIQRNEICSMSHRLSLHLPLASGETESLSHSGERNLSTDPPLYGPLFQARIDSPPDLSQGGNGH